MLMGEIAEEDRGGALTRVGAKAAEEPMRATDSSERSFITTVVANEGPAAENKQTS
jgi:hypothetical protein